MAIGVVSFAFVALLGLLPMGLQTLRAAIDSGNEARIVQAITGSVLATEFARLETLDFSGSGEVLYFDDEGNPTTDLLRQVYGVKLFVQDAQWTGVESRQARRVGVLVCVKASSAWKRFLSIATADSLGREPLPPELHVHSVIMARMDGVPGS